MIIKRIGLFLLLVPCIALGQSNSIEGYWEGAQVYEGAVRIIRLDISEQESGWMGLLSMPDFGALDLPMPLKYDGEEMTFRLGRSPITMKVDHYNGEMRALVYAPDSTTGTVHLKRGYRPATPKLRTENVTIPVDDITLGGTLVLPAGPGPHPATVFLQGRGYGSRNGLLGDAIRFARRGVAGLVFDGRGVGESGGDAGLTTQEDRFADGLAAVNLLLERDDIDPDQIGLWGTSAGGWVAPVVAERSGRIAFMILDVGPAESLADQQGHVIEYQMRWSDKEFTEAELRAAFDYQKKLVELSAAGADWSAFEPLVAEAGQQSWSEYVDLPEDMNNSELDYFRRQPFDPVPALRKVTFPVIAFYGDRDFVVPPQENVEKLQQYMAEARNEDVSIHVFPEANHSLFIGSGEMGEGDAWPDRFFRWPRLAPGFHEILFKWLEDRVEVAME